MLIKLQQQQPHRFVATLSGHYFRRQNPRQMLGVAEHEVLLRPFQGLHRAHQQRGAVVVGIDQPGQVHAHQGAGGRQLHGLFQDFADAGIQHSGKRNISPSAAALAGAVRTFGDGAPGRRRFLEAARKRQGQRLKSRAATENLEQLEQANPDAFCGIVQVFAALERGLQPAHRLQILPCGMQGGGLLQRRRQ